MLRNSLAKACDGRGAAIVVAVAAVAAFVPALGAAFAYDDFRFVAENEAIRSLANAPDFLLDPRTVDPENWQGIYRPLRTLSFAVDHALWGDRPLGYHLQNLVWHALAAVLLLRLLRALGLSPVGALVAVLLFAVHPVQAESVAWITSRGDVLCGALVLLALLLHARAEAPSVGRSLLVAATLLLACLAKESAAVVPVLIVLVDLLVLRPGRRSGDRGGSPSLARHALVVWLPLFATVGLFVLFRQWRADIYAPGGTLGHLAHSWGGSWTAQLVVAARGFLVHVGTVLFPVGPRLDAYVPTDGAIDGQAVLGAAILLGLLVAAGGLRRTRPLAALGILWFLVAQAPTANVLVTVGIPSADRFLYLPLAGAGLAAVAVLPALRDLRLATLLVLPLAALAIQDTLAWFDNETLWSTASAPGSPRRLIHLFQEAQDGFLEDWEAGRRDRSRIPGVVAEGRAALERWREIVGPREVLGLPRTRMKLANLERLRGERLSAWRYLDEAARTAPDHPRIHYLAGLLASDAGDLDVARASFVRARERGFPEPVSSELGTTLNALATRALEAGLFGRAVGRLRESLREWPAAEGNETAGPALAGIEATVRGLRPGSEPPGSDLEAWFRRGVLLGQIGETKQAIEILGGLERTLPRDPEIPIALARCGWEEIGDLPAAAAAYRRALEIDPRHVEARRGLVRCGGLRMEAWRRDPGSRLALLEGLGEEPALLVARARALIDLDRRTEARARLERAAAAEGPGVMDALDLLLREERRHG